MESMVDSQIVAFAFAAAVLTRSPSIGRAVCR
jgi:hypothetical protein